MIKYGLKDQTFHFPLPKEHSEGTMFSEYRYSNVQNILHQSILKDANQDCVLMPCRKIEQRRIAQRLKNSKQRLCRNEECLFLLKAQRQSLEMAKKILIVDDEPDICFVLEKALGENGFLIDSYEDPLLALFNFKTH